MAIATALHPRTSSLAIRRPVGLRVFSDDLFLSGRFHRWEAAVSMGPDLDELTVRMAVDATSPDAVDDDRENGNLFTFKSTDVVAKDSHRHEARGELVTPSGAQPFRITIETPEGHNAYFVISFIARRQDLGFGWKELVSDVFDLGGMDAERRQDPRMGVRDPVVAAS